MNINIFPAVPEDAKYIQKINSKTWLDTYKNEKLGINDELIKNNPTNEGSKKLFLKRKIGEIVENPGSYFIVRDKDKVIGYANGKKNKTKSYNELVSIYILAEYHKKGIGKKLVGRIFDYLGDEKDIVIEVVGYNKNAICFYENLGFIFNKNLDKFEIIDGVWVPEIQMIKNVG